jgi:hypothetical protein
MQFFQKKKSGSNQILQKRLGEWVGGKIVAHVMLASIKARRNNGQINGKCTLS